MPPSPAQIKEKLIKALDEDKNVINEKAVEEVIGLLEASVITKEILEQTRLGRDVNLVRKNSKNPAIAKRAKNLVKAWQKLIDDPGSPRINGQHPAVRSSPGLSSAPSPALLQAKQLQSSHLSPAVAGRVHTPPVARPTTKVARIKQQPPVSPAIRQTQLSSQGKQTATSNGDSNLSWAATSPSPTNLSESSQDRLLGDRENYESKGGPRTCGPPPANSKRNFKLDPKPSDHSTASASKSVNRASDQRDVSKTNVANRKRTRSNTKEDSKNSLNCDTPPPSKHSRLVSPSSQSLSTSHKRDVINGVHVKKHADSAATLASAVEAPGTPATKDTADYALSQRLQLSVLRQDSTDSRGSSKAGKVKTTEQIIEDMQRKSVDSNVIAQIRTSLNQKEAAEAAQKAAAEAASNSERVPKKRGRKKKGSVANASDAPPVKHELELPNVNRTSDNRQLAQAKSEYIKRFLQTSVAPTPEEDDFSEHTRSLTGQESLEDPSQPQIPLGGCSTSFVQPTYEPGFPAYASRQDKPDSGPSASPPDARDILEGSTSTALQDNMSEQQALARLPPLHPESIDWALHDYSAPEAQPVDEDLINRLHNGEVNAVNGTFDKFGVFRRWQHLLTADTAYDEPLYILPYVVPND